MIVIKYTDILNSDKYETKVDPHVPFSITFTELKGGITGRYIRIVDRNDSSSFIEVGINDYFKRIFELTLVGINPNLISCVRTLPVLNQKVESGTPQINDDYWDDEKLPIVAENYKEFKSKLSLIISETACELLFSESEIVLVVKNENLELLFDKNSNLAGLRINDLENETISTLKEYKD